MWRETFDNDATTRGLQAEEGGVAVDLGDVRPSSYGVVNVTSGIAILREDQDLLSGQRPVQQFQQCQEFAVFVWADRTQGGAYSGESPFIVLQLCSKLGDSPCVNRRRGQHEFEKCKLTAGVIGRAAKGSAVVRPRQDSFRFDGSKRGLTPSELLNDGAAKCLGTRFQPFQ